MSGANENSRLPRGAEDIRRRQEHVDRRIVQMPMLFSTPSEADVEFKGMVLIHEAFLSELRDLYTILSSIDSRKYDICRSDIRAMFEWFAIFENFLRLYFTVSETQIYQAAQIDEWENIGGLLSKERRKKEKKKIIELCDKVEAMKRILIAEGDRGEKRSVQKLRERVDRFTVRLLRFLDEEVGHVPGDLENRFFDRETDAMFRRLVNEMRNCEHGRDMVVVLAKGLGKDASGMGTWLVKNCDKGTKGAVQKWMGQFVERHTNYVKLFEKAEYEYRRLYKSLGRSVDEEIEGLRKDFGRRLRAVNSGSSGAAEA